MFEGEHLFTGNDPELRTYRSRAHLAEMISLLGQPPIGFLGRGQLSSKFFSETGRSPSKHYTVIHSNMLADITRY